MKRGFKLTLVMLVLTLGLASRHPDRMPTWDLVKLVSFNRGDASDMASGSFRQSPTLNGNATVTGSAVYLDGVNDYVSFPDAAFLSATDGAGNDTAFSVSAWVNLDVANNVNRHMVAKFNPTGNQREWIFMCTSNFTTGSSMKGPVLYLTNGAATGVIVRGETVNNMTTGAWIHLVATYSGNESTTGINIYRNGQAVDDGNTSVGAYTGMANGTAQFTIGADDSAGGDLAGYVDDVRYYRRELTAAEVGQIYAAGRD